VELPFETWEDVLEAARQLRAARPDGGSTWATTNSSFDPLYHHMVNWGVPLDGAKPDLTSDQGIALIDWYLTMRAEDLVLEEQVAWGQDESRGVFVAGGAAMIQAGLNAAVDFLETPDFDFGEDWAATVMPIQPGGGRMAVPRGWSIVSESEHPYEASLVLRYLAEAENAQSRLLKGSQTPLNTVVLNSPEVAEYFPHMTEDIKEKFLGETVALPAAADIGTVGPVLIELRLEIIAGTDESAEALAERYQALLEEASS
jgi:ABC-type glycerol-3-phosphate transport system substrate-binding protein